MKTIYLYSLAVFLFTPSFFAHSSWIIDSQKDWEQSTGLQSHLEINEGMVTPAAKTASFQSHLKHWVKEDPERFETDFGEYEVHEPEQECFGDWSAICVGGQYYLSVQGDDQNPGTREAPFRHIQRFADIARPGDICLVRQGTYRETVRPKNGGRTGDPIRYVAYPGEKVTISGTEAITGPWLHYRGSIYQTKVDRDVEQLFADGKMMIEARWPNIRFEDL